MAYRNGNYCAFYVDEPFSENNLGANSTHDFVYYNLLKAWKAADTDFPFIDSHDKTYNVRDGSDWETTLKPRLRERIRNSKNIVLFLSSITKNSRALSEEIDYGINTMGLPIIVVYPDYTTYDDLVESDSRMIMEEIVDLWEKLPKFKSSIDKIPSMHMPLNKEYIRQALSDPGFMVKTKTESGTYILRN